MHGNDSGYPHGLAIAVYPYRVYNFDMKEKTKKQVENRLKRIMGQVGGLHKMVSEDKYCIDIITQSSAARSALSAVEDLVLLNHLSEHVIHQMKQGQERKAVGEIISVFKKSKKK